MVWDRCVINFKNFNTVRPGHFKKLLCLWLCASQSVSQRGTVTMTRNSVSINISQDSGFVLLLASKDLRTKAFFSKIQLNTDL